MPSKTPQLVALDIQLQEQSLAGKARGTNPFVQPDN